MKKKEKKQNDWAERLASHRAACDMAFEELDKLVQEFQDGENIQKPLDRFRENMREIRRSAEQLHEELYTVPIRKICSVERRNITEQQYLLARAAGLGLFTAQGLGISPVSDYEVYRNYVYEDDEAVRFMDPDETPDVKTPNKKTGGYRIRIRLACSPEETGLAHYTPEQREFFAKYRPDVLARAQQDKPGRSEPECPPTKGGKATSGKSDNERKSTK